MMGAGARIDEGVGAVLFASLSRTLTDTARALDLTPPRFQAPPRHPGESRTLTHNDDGSVTVRVAIRGRHRDAVAADMVAGVLAANGLPLDHSDGVDLAEVAGFLFVLADAGDDNRRGDTSEATP